MAIYVGSKLRVEFTFTDVLPDGTEAAIDLDTVTSKSVRIIRPDGTEFTSPSLVVTDATAGEAYWEADDSLDLDQVGTWRAQGNVDGYLSAPVSWRVSRNP